MKNVTITQQAGYIYLWVGNYILEVYTDMKRANKRMQEIKLLLAK